jgi:ribosome-associated protein
MDYIDFVVHIFTARAREFYDLERLWRAGTRRDVNELIAQRT